MKEKTVDYAKCDLSGNITDAEIEAREQKPPDLLDPTENRINGATNENENRGVKPKPEQDRNRPDNNVSSLAQQDPPRPSKKSRGSGNPRSSLALSGCRAREGKEHLKNEVSRKKVIVKINDEQRKLLRERCKDILFNLSNDESVNSVAKYRNPEDLPTREEDELKYHLLARITKGHQSRALNILRAQNTADGKVRPELVERPSFRFVFLVDNSGSMFGEKLTLSLTVLTVLLETMKRMEFDTAVVRFGGEQSQEVLKAFDNAMNNERGQFILEAFDATEKTLALDAVKFVAETESLFKLPCKPNEYRFIILVTDGIWNQVDRGAYAKYFSKAAAWPLILTTNPSKSEDLHFYNMSVRKAKEILNHIAPESWYGLDHENDLSDQISYIAEMLNRKMLDHLDKEIERMQDIRLHFSDLKVAELPTTSSVIPSELQYKCSGNIEWGTSIYASDISSIRDYEVPNEDFITAFANFVANQDVQVKQKLENPEASPAIESYAQIIRQHEDQIRDEVSDVDNIFDTVVFPNNRPTRAVQDYHGPTFSLRGFIRFICTDGQYKKIYENVIGHPRKDYRVSVILDTSTSMIGMTAAGSINTFLTLAGSLHNVGVDFSLMTCAAHTSVVKGFDQAWDDVAKARAFQAIKFEEQESNIGDSVLYASHTLQQGGSSRTVKMMFVITDGYDSCPGRLRSCLGLAESQGVMVIGVGVGFFTDAVRAYFPRYVIVNNPSLLAKGLQKLFTGGGEKRREVVDAMGNVFIEEEKSVEHGGKTLSKVDEIWEHEMKAVYQQEVERTKRAVFFATSSISRKIGTGDLSIDLCFVVDTTYSMYPVIEMAKRYTAEMAKDIERIVSNYGKAAKLRIGFVSFRFFTNLRHLENIRLTNDISSVMTFINRMSAGEGSWIDGRPDKCGGLRVALDMAWQGRVKFIVLIGDVDDHVMECQGCKLCQKSRISGGIKNYATVIAQKGIYLMYVRITEYTDREEAAMKRAYVNAAAPNMKDSGFMSLDISDKSSSDYLKTMITGGIESVIVLDFL